MKALAAFFLMLAPWAALAQSPPQVIPVTRLSAAPQVDGSLADWPREGWTAVKVSPAVAANEREKFGLDPEDRNLTGSLTVELRAGVFGDRVYVAARWPDDAADTEYKGWEWAGGRYVEGKRRDDAFALRFHLSGDYDRTMLSAKSYVADVWFWSAARTNPSGYAEDWTHQVSTRMIEDAAEYAVKGVGTVYIKKLRDAGIGPYRALPRPKERSGDRLPSFEVVRSPAGSVADVQARGRWAAGAWSLEFARKLDTGHADDVAFAAGKKLLGQVAVFNRGADENKSVSEPLLFDFAAPGR